MSIVRSLLISIGFKTDKKEIAEANKAIKGFKAEYALVASTAAYAFKVVTDFFNGIAAATLDTDELARSLGYTLNEVVALQQAFQKFRINDSQASAVLQTLNKDLYEFRQGYGRLAHLLSQTGIVIPKNAGPVQLLDTILRYLREIDDEVARSAVANQFFPGLGIKIASVAKDFDGFKESVAGAFAELEKAPNVVPQLTEYEKAVNGIGQSLNDLFKTIVVNVAPAVSFLAKNIEVLVNLLSGILSFDWDKIKNAFGGIADQFARFYGFLGGKIGGALSPITTPLSGAWSDFIDYAENRNPGQSMQMPESNWVENALPSSWLNYINNTVDINVPQGTTVEQSAYLGGQIERMIEASINATFSQIQYNNPVIE